MTQNDCEQTLVNLFDTIDLIFWEEDVGQKVTAYPMQDFTHPECGYWYEIKHLSVLPEQIELGQHSMNKWQGIMQIDICVYKDIKARRSTHKDYGVEFYVNNAYSAIAEVMKRGVIKDRVHIVKVGKSSAIDNDEYYSVPISVQWYANLSN